MHGPDLYDEQIFMCLLDIAFSDISTIQSIGHLGSPRRLSLYIQRNSFSSILFVAFSFCPIFRLTAFKTKNMFRSTARQAVKRAARIGACTWKAQLFIEGVF